MISKEMNDALNAQMQLEGYASFLYLAMASWCDVKGLEGCTKFMHRQSNEEMDHMMRIFHYISEVDGHAIVPGIKQPPTEWESPHKLFQEVYAHEQKVTAAINKLVDLCYKVDDYSTLNFLQWYIEEQREEEDLMRTILDRIKLIGEGPLTLYYIDKEIEEINKSAAKAEGN